MRFRICLNLLVLLLYIIKDGCEAAIPQIVQSIVTETKPIKGTAYLNCTVAMMNNNAPVKWIRVEDTMALTDGLKITVVNNNGRYDIKKEVGRSRVIPVMPDGTTLTLETYTLIIKDLQRGDGGEYKCMVDQSGLESYQKPFAIGRLVVQSPATIQPGPLLVPQVVNERGTLKLECRADGQPAPIISWTRASGKPLNVKPLKGHTQKPQRFYGKTLIIKNMTRDDRGIYRCHAQNNVDRSAEYDVVVEVNFPPKAFVARKDGYYAQSDQGLFTVALECLVSGYPAPDVKFFKGYYDPPRLTPSELMDQPYQEVTRFYSYGAAGLSFDEYLYELRIENVKSNAYGIYTCYAENSFGTSNATLTLKNQPMCQGPLCFISQYAATASLSGTHLRPSPFVLGVLVLLLGLWWR